MVSVDTLSSRSGLGPLREAVWVGAFLYAWAGMPCRIALAEETKVAFDVNDVVRSIGREVRGDPLLEGAWLDVDVGNRDGSHQFAVRRIFDAGRESEQSRAMDRILNTVLPVGSYAIDPARDIKVPYGELKSTMQSRLKSESKYDGCRYLGATFAENPDDGSLQLMPRLETVKQSQFEEFVRECRSFMGRQPAWARARIAVVDNSPEQIRIKVEPAGPELNALDRQVRSAIRVNPALKGSWIEVDKRSVDSGGIGPDIYEFTRTFDASRVSEQAAAMDQFIELSVPSGRHRVDGSKDKQLPLTRLLNEVRAATDVEPSLAGCLVASAYYVRNSDDGTYSLVLEGRLWKSQQESLLHDLCRRLMAKDPVWQAARVGVLDTERNALAVVLPNLALGATYYSEAMHKFWKHDYAGAGEALALASLEDPENVVYRYWRVLCELGVGDNASAEHRLDRTVKGFRVGPYSAEHIRVLRAIYRVQGPLRQSLMDTERKVMAHQTIHAPSDETSRAVN